MGWETNLPFSNRRVKFGFETWDLKNMIKYDTKRGAEIRGLGVWHSSSVSVNPLLDKSWSMKTYRNDLKTYNIKYKKVVWHENARWYQKIGPVHPLPIIISHEMFHNISL